MAKKVEVGGAERRDTVGGDREREGCSTPHPSFSAAAQDMVFGASKQRLSSPPITTDPP